MAARKFDAKKFAQQNDPKPERAPRTAALNIKIGGRWLQVVGIAVALFGLLFCLTHHVVLSSHGTQIISKVHWSLSETFVSLDTITTIPAFKANAEHPLAIKALEREGILETDEQREERVRAKLAAAEQAALADIQAQVNTALRK